ncbi:MAG: hypothetical protein ACFFCS_12340 [Candidatus Hodarchaeota archaeon]
MKVLKGKEKMNIVQFPPRMNRHPCNPGEPENHGNFFLFIKKGSINKGRTNQGVCTITSESKNLPMIPYDELEDLIALHPDHENLEGIEGVRILFKNELVLASDLRDFGIEQVNSNVKAGNPEVDKFFHDMYNDWKELDFNYFETWVKSCVNDETLSRGQKAGLIARINVLVRWMQELVGGYEPGRLLSKFLVALLAERLEKGNGMKHLRDLPGLNGHELGLVLKHCMMDNGKDLGGALLEQLAGFLKASCKKLSRERPMEFRAVKKYFLDLMNENTLETETSLLGMLCNEPFFVECNPLFDDGVEPLVISKGEINRTSIEIGGKTSDLLVRIRDVLGACHVNALSQCPVENVKDIVIEYRALLNSYNCTMMATGGRNDLETASMLYHINHEFLGNEKMTGVREYCVSEPVIPISDLGVVSFKKNEQSKGKSSKEWITRTYNVPLTVPSELKEFLANSGLNDRCKRAIIGLCKHVSASIIRQIQAKINEECRKKSVILKGKLKDLESPPPKSNTYYRDVFKDSSKIGEIATYFVKNTVLGQYKHLYGKFDLLREILKEGTVSMVAPFVTCNHVEKGLRQQVAFDFNWKLSHVRPQLRGIRRLAERSKNFDKNLNLTAKNDEFARLRAGVDELLETRSMKDGMNLKIVGCILDKFQKGHVLHVLLLSREEIHGIYPRQLKINGKKYDSGMIEVQVKLLKKFCHENRARLDNLVKGCLSGLVRLSHGDVSSTIDVIRKEQERHVKMLKDKGYGTYHANRKLKALETLQSSKAWMRYLDCGVIPSERFVKYLAKLASAMPGNKVKLEMALYPVISTAHVKTLASIKGCKVEELLEGFIDGCRASTSTRFPFTSPRNRKMYSTLDLIPVNNQFVVIRPGSCSNDLLTSYLRNGKVIPLYFAPGEIMLYYSGSTMGKLNEKTLKDHIKEILIKKRYVMGDITTILNLIDFNGCKEISMKTLRKRESQLSPLAKFLINPSIEINLFNNKRLSKEFHKIKEIIKNPWVVLSPIRILPATNMNDNCTCQLVFKCLMDIREFKSSVRFMKDIKIGKCRKKEIVALDVNREDKERVFIARDWPSSERYIKENRLEKKLKRRIYNEDKDKEFTAYVHDGRTSKLVSKHINSLSWALKKNLVHLNKVKKVKKKVQGAFNKHKFHCIARAAKCYKDIVQVARSAGLTREAVALQDILHQIKNTPKNKVHLLRKSRDVRNEAIRQLLEKLKELSPPRAYKLEDEFKTIRKSGKKIYCLETELQRIKHKINNLRKEIKIKLSMLVGMVICEIHPGELVYEELNVKHQGLKGALGEITKYMPEMGEFISKAVEIANLHAESLNVKLLTRVRGVHPGGSSSPPHIPTGLGFNRGGKNGWHVITIPPTEKDGICYPELKINSHVLSCQKLCEKASGS